MASRPVPRARPRAPHLFKGFLSLHYRWGPHMLVSILHRATGSGMATVGTLLLVWWLAALASGQKAYATFVDVFTGQGGDLNILGWVLGVGLTWSLFQHMMSGLRHLVMDAGAGFELATNRNLARLTMLFSTALTAVFWFVVRAY